MPLTTVAEWQTKINEWNTDGVRLANSLIDPQKNGTIKDCMAMCYGRSPNKIRTYDCLSIAMRKDDTGWSCQVLQTRVDKTASVKPDTDIEGLLRTAGVLNATNASRIEDDRQQLFFNAPYWHTDDFSELTIMHILYKCAENI